MQYSWRLAVYALTSLGVAVAMTNAIAQPFGMGAGMMHGMGSGRAGEAHHPMHGAMHGPMAHATAMLTKQDAGSAADMGLVHELLTNHTQIRRTVTNLPNGIRTVTESDDPKVAQVIKAHVASMSERLKDGREFNIFSSTLPVLFDKRDKIISKIEMTAKGSMVTRTSTDAEVVVALQGHAGEVTELVQDGPVAMRRGMMARMAMRSLGPRGGMNAGNLPGSPTPATPAHAH